MLTKVILEGAFGKQFGREWHLDVNSPTDALRMIDANKPGAIAWMRDNLAKFSAYSVICKHKNGKVEYLDEKDLELQGELVSIRFVPILTGSGGNMGKVILGIVMIAAAVYLGPAAIGGTGFLSGSAAMQVGMMGASLMLAGASQALSPTPSKSTSLTSHYFNGPVNTTGQGAPVQLIYGTCLVGSNAISAALNVDQMI